MKVKNKNCIHEENMTDYGLKWLRFKCVYRLFYSFLRISFFETKETVAGVLESFSKYRQKHLNVK